MGANDIGSKIAGADSSRSSTNANSTTLADTINRLEMGQRQLSEKVDLQLQLLDAILECSKNNRKQPAATEVIPRRVPAPPLDTISKTQMPSEDEVGVGTMSKDIKALHGALGWQKTIDDMFKIEPTADIVTRFASGSYWVLLCIALIILSTVIVAIETELSTTHAVGLALSEEGTVRPPPEFNDSLFKTIERVVLGWMIFEVLVNAWAQRRGFIFGRDWQWNAFDVTVIVVSLIALFLEAMSFSFLRVTRIARLFRMGKILRIFRIVRFMRAVRNMLVSISGSVLHLFSALTVMCIFMFVTSLVLMQGVASDISKVPPEPPSGARVLASLFDNAAEQTRIQEIATLYGNLPRSMMTLFLTISGGLEWSKAAGPLVKLGAFYGVIWTAYVAFMVFGMLNVLTGIFVEQAMAAMVNDKDNMIQTALEERESLIQTIRNVFKDSDIDGSGYVTQQEMDVLLENPELQAYIKAIGIDSTEAKGLFVLLDDDASGTVCIDEFVTGFLRLKGGAKAVDMVTLMFENRKIFKKLNKVVQEVRMVNEAVDAMHQEYSSLRLIAL